MCGLQWPDVNLADGFLVVERAIEQASQGLVVVPPKSEAGQRVVPLPAQAVDVLLVHCLRQDELRLARRGRWNEERWVMATLDGRSMSPDTISSSWTRFVKTRKLPHLDLHGLRHSYATDLFENALDGGKESMLKIVRER
jgi:integrase